ncbi:hypothetical protein QC762_704830 [Podospora pseudocomata]|uniref:DUF1993 domain-containing protein n=1 Tax=Podospora pseudocomata TaxID=2093779 RepID=A0ABR0G260_9PEZI|nr:hypothetical protein QC762_704830 [Podospora pseudocomata]
MSLTLSSITISTFSKGLSTLVHILQKAEEYAASQGLDANAEYINARLIDDMLPLTFQVQNATNTVRKTLTRSQGKADQPWEDGEKTFADLYARIEKARQVIKEADAAAIDAKADETVDLALGPTTIKIVSRDSVLNQGIPNFFFHLNTAYAILRSKGVPVGKRDYIGSFLA